MSIYKYKYILKKKLLLNYYKYSIKIILKNISLFKVNL